MSCVLIIWAMRLWLRLFVVSGISTESVQSRIAVLAGSSGLRECVMVSSITLEVMCSPCRRLRNALACGEVLRNEMAVIVSSVIGVWNIFCISLVMLGVVEIRVCALFRAGGGSLACVLGVVSFCLVRFCGGGPAAHSVQSRLRASKSERVCNHLVVCRLSVSSVLIATPALWCVLCLSRCSLPSFSCCLSGVLFRSVHVACE